MADLPIVPFGKYKGKPITDLIADNSYLEWCKQQEWFKKFPIIYNICINNTITNNTNSKTPEYIKPSKTVHKIGNNTFKTKDDAENYVRDLIISIGMCDSVKSLSLEIFNELLDILQCHPNKDKVADIIDIRIIKNKLNSKAFEINILKSDNMYEDISWRICVSGLHKTHKQELLSALRYSIDEQIYHYKQSVSIDTCTLCSELCNVNGGTHVDHVVHFEKLINDFHTICNIRVPITFDNATDGSNRRRFKDEDYEYATEWQKYHKNNAILRILCSECNLKREKYSKSL